MSENIFNLEKYDYQLPEELIAQEPVEPRDMCRLMVLDRAKRS
ncbi:MAG: S-adenosylmethionine:tRNA ribosyltransferase-isomerase, partial [Defluviitoga tunisiensis]|nr:S-adenosylmethionine:tRNA ribosyltransferase-isomerase [Defluviitoga tunisiensis]